MADPERTSVARARTAAGAIDRVAPFLFMCLWSGGYVGAKFTVRDATPIAAVSLRFALATLLFLAIAALVRAPWPRTRREVAAIAVCGLLIQGLCFSFNYLAFAAGVGAGAMALIMALQPILTACVAGPLLGERVRPLQWLGLILGLVGVTLVLQNKLAQGVGTLTGIVWGVCGLAAITVGTLFQKRVCPRFDLWTGGVIQYAAAVAFTTPLALLVEDPFIRWTPGFIGSLAYLLVGNSLIAVSLFNLMIHKGEAARVTSLLFLVPGGAAFLGWLLLGETFTGTALLGLVVGAAGVGLVLRPARSG